MLCRLLKEVGDVQETSSNLVRMYHCGRKSPCSSQNSPSHSQWPRWLAVAYVEWVLVMIKDTVKIWKDSRCPLMWTVLSSYFPLPLLHLEETYPSSSPNWCVPLDWWRRGRGHADGSREGRHCIFKGSEDLLCCLILTVLLFGGSSFIVVPIQHLAYYLVPSWTGKQKRRQVK